MTKLPPPGGALTVTVNVALPLGVTEMGTAGETETSVNGAATVRLSIVCGRSNAVLVRVMVCVNCPPATVVIGQVEQTLCGEGPKYPDVIPLYSIAQFTPVTVTVGRKTPVKYSRASTSRRTMITAATIAPALDFFGGGAW